MATAGAPSAKNAPSHMEAGTTWYYNGADSQGLSYEKTILANGTTEHKHYVNAGGVTFALYVQREGNLNGKPATSTSYFHHDHLGSIAAVSNAAGVVVERMAYDPWGKRRFSNGTNDRLDALYGVSTDRGYTMHEHLDEMGIIHMNGRVYDPLNGRFMSSDPIIQEPGNLQSYNRYAYVFNNPLLFTDLSGYSAWTKFRDRVLKPVAFAYIGYLTGGLAMNAIIPSSMGVAGGGLLAVGGAVGGFTAGALSTGTFKGAVQGAFTGALFGAAGSVGIADSGARYLAHAGAGCVSSVAGGGNCGQGAASAVFGKFTTNQIGGVGANAPVGEVIAKGIATAVAGGVGSTMAGGKFENGAITAAFGYLFNECANTRACGSDSTKVSVSGNRVLADMAHSEIQISSGYDFVVLEGQPGYSNGNNRLEGRSNGANQGDAFSIGLSPSDGRTMAQFAGDLQTAGASYKNNLTYSFPSIRNGFSNMNGGYNSNSFVGGVLDATASGAGFRYVVQGAASRAGFRVPGMENPIPLSPVR